MTAIPARALLTFNDGKDQIFTSATYSWGYDTNVFANTATRGSVTQAFSWGANYTRKAGVIGVNASIGMNAGQFVGIPGQDYDDPNITLSFNKGVGRTTGNLMIQAQKVNSPDPIANNRQVGWEYTAALNLRYPIIERFYITNVTTVGGSSYANRALFANQQSYSDGIDVNFVYDSKLDLRAGYGFALEKTHDTTAIHHAFDVGANGTIAPQLSGSLITGFVIDQTSYSSGKGKAETFTGLTATANLNWRFSRSLSFTGTAAKDFGISSTDVTTDSTTLGLTSETTLFKRFRTSVGVTYVGTSFLGRNGGGRRDTLWELVANVGTALTTHLRANLAYAYMVNYSNFSTARFIRETITLSVTATY